MSPARRTATPCRGCAEARILTPVYLCHTLPASIGRAGRARHCVVSKRRAIGAATSSYAEPVYVGRRVYVARAFDVPDDRRPHAHPEVTHPCRGIRLATPPHSGALGAWGLNALLELELWTQLRCRCALS